jgi:hypothetical protein
MRTILTEKFPGSDGGQANLGANCYKLAQSMIRMSGYRFSLATNAERVCAEIMPRPRMER